MKDKSKAKWPERMGCDANNGAITARIFGDYDTDNERFIGRICGDDNEQAFVRAKQVCALPEMVALLKRIHKDEGFYDGQENWQPNCFVEEARILLRKIGEME